MDFAIVFCDNEMMKQNVVKDLPVLHCKVDDPERKNGSDLLSPCTYGRIRSSLTIK